MKSLTLLALFAIFAFAVAEPPRRRPSNFRSFARQEGAPEEENPPPPASGYNYDAPQGEQLRLPTKFTASRFKSGRQQEETTPSSTSGGYSYPKPTESYGPPDETTQPEGEYGPPDEDSSTPAPVDDSAATDNPQAERLRGFNRKNARLTRLQASQKVRVQPTAAKARVQLQQQQQQQLTQPQQPIYYVVNTVPVAEYVQPQLEYYYVLNK